MIIRARGKIKRRYENEQRCYQASEHQKTEKEI